MADNDIAVTANSVSDNDYDSRKSEKRKLEEEKFELMSYDQKRMRYFEVKKITWENMTMKKISFWDTNMLPFYYYDKLMYKLVKKIDSSNKDKDDIEYEIEDKLKTRQKYAIDYVGIWDARTVEEALNWFAATYIEDCLRRFVELVLKEQPEKNFSEALERVCKAWNKIRESFTYEELFNDDAKSEKVKLEYCDWLGTEIKERDVTLYKYGELWNPLREKLLLPDYVYFGEMLSDFRFYARHSIDYVGIWDARTVEEALSWMVVFGDREAICRFIELVLLEQPEKNFSEALERVCKTWDDIRKVYTYEELFNNKGRNRKSNKVKFEYCDWLKIEKIRKEDE